MRSADLMRVRRAAGVAVSVPLVHDQVDQDQALAPSTHTTTTSTYVCPHTTYIRIHICMYVDVVDHIHIHTVITIVVKSRLT